MVYKTINIEILQDYFKHNKIINIIELYKVVLKSYDIVIGDKVNYYILLKQMAVDRKQYILEDNDTLIRIFDCIMTLIIYIHIKNDIGFEERRKILEKAVQSAKILGFELKKP
jgi:hypothetical protein